MATVRGKSTARSPRTLKRALARRLYRRIQTATDPTSHPSPRLTDIGASNGLLPQYFPKGSDLSVHNEADLDWVAAELHDRPRKSLDYATPTELIGDLLQG